MNTSTPNSTWPYDQEIFYHLDYVPYIDLKVKFDPRPMLEEAFALLDHFVEHRSHTQENKVSDGRWKSLGLRTFGGDHAKTEYHTSYTAEEKGVYLNTAMLDLCPQTRKFLEGITDIEQCDRVRFMLLEPGTEIKVHSDSARDVSFAINISLNMPEGCEFWSNLNPDGSLNDYSLKVPFADSGSVFLFNNAKYHKLKNDSSLPRMHIIFHGPINFHDDYVLARAREQNKIFNRKELLKKLVEKKALTGESFSKTPALLKDWVNSGQTEDALGELVALAVLNTTEEALEKITVPSIFPLRFEVIDDIDDYLNHLEGKRYAVICAAGTFVRQTNSFVLEVFKQIHLMQENNAIVSGHIIDRVNEIPHFHQQFLVVDLSEWKKSGAVKFGPFFGEKKISFPTHERGKDIHDDYTPEFLRAGVTCASRNGIAHWGTEVIAAALENGRAILNLSSTLRDTKDYTYPLDQNQSARERVLNIIQVSAAEAREDVFFFNNEELNIPQIKNFRPTRLVSVAAGFKAIKILEQYAYPSDAKIFYADFSMNALRYIKAVNAQSDVQLLLAQIEKFNKVLRPAQWSKGLNENLLKATIRDCFDNDEAVFFKYLKLASKADLHEMNFVLEPEKIVQLLDGEPFIIWSSNAFYNNHLYHLLGVSETEKRYHELARLIANKFKMKAFAEKKSRNILFGESIERPVGFLTDGCSAFISDKAEDYFDLN